MEKPKNNQLHKQFKCFDNIYLNRIVDASNGLIGILLGGERVIICVKFVEVRL